MPGGGIEIGRWIGVDPHPVLALDLFAQGKNLDEGIDSKGEGPQAQTGSRRQ